MSASSPCPSTELFRQGISLFTAQQSRRELSSQRALDHLVVQKDTLVHACELQES